MKTNQLRRFILTFYLALSGASVLTVTASPFLNLGFDNPNLDGLPAPPHIGTGSFWMTPGWTVSKEVVGWNLSQTFMGVSSILDVNFRDTHFGLNAPAPVVGNFSLGVWPWPVPGLPFTLSQTGDIPADAQSLQFLYQGNDLRVFVGGSLEPMNFIGTRPTDNPAAPTAPYFAVDVSPFAGKTAELKFEFRSYGYDDFSGGPRIPINLPNAQSHVLDDLKFSALPASVPEPGTYALFALGFAALGWYLRRQQRPR